MKRLMFAALVLAPGCMTDTDANSDELGTNNGDEHGVPQDAQIQWAKGAKPGGGGSSDPHLLYHGGPDRKSVV